MSDGLWLHAVTRELEPGAADGLAGVRTVAVPGLVAVVSPVDLDEYGEEALRRNLEDLEWLERTARSHHAVVDALARDRPIVPARLATVYRDDAGVRAMLRDRRADLEAALHRIEDRSEWGVKMYAVPAEAAAGEPDNRSGTAYLNRRRAELSADDARRRRAADGAEEAAAALAGHAVESRRHPLQDRRLTGRPEPMLLNAAYLVDRAEAEAFAGSVAGEAARHRELRLELTGPWPPYSFTTEQSEEPEQPEQAEQPEQTEQPEQAS